MENDPKPYKFMKESIKKQPPDWKKIVLLIAGWLALAALGGLVAAAVFAVTEPKIAEAVTREEPPAKVDIPGVWHLSHEGLDLENPANEPQYNKPGFLELGVSPEQAPDTPTYITLHFEKGIPTAVDGKEMGAVELVEYLNKVGGENGIGLLDIVENRLVGMKSRGVYETPGGAILYKAINVLETITLDKESAHFKAQMAQKYADIVYNGQWFTPLREALDAFADSLEKTVTGDVKLKLYKGNMINAGVTSPYTLYDEQTASFGVDKDYDQSDATGFINLFGLSIKERAKLSKNWPEVKE